MSWLLLLLAFGFHIGYKALSVKSLSEYGITADHFSSHAVLWPLFVSIALMIRFFFLHSGGTTEEQRLSLPWSGIFLLGGFISVVVASALSDETAASQSAIAADNFVILSMIFAFVSMVKEKYGVKNEDRGTLLRSYIFLYSSSFLLISIFVARPIVETEALIAGTDHNDGIYGTVIGISAGLIILSGFFVTAAEILLLSRGGPIRWLHVIPAVAVFFMGAIAFYSPEMIGSMTTTNDIALRILYGILFSVVLAIILTSTGRVFHALSPKPYPTYQLRNR